MTIFLYLLAFTLYFAMTNKQEWPRHKGLTHIFFASTLFAKQAKFFTYNKNFRVFPQKTNLNNQMQSSFIG